MSGTELFKLFGTIGLNGVDGVEKELNGVTGKAESAGTKMVSAFKKIGAAVATYFTVDAVVNFGKSCVNAAAEVGAEAAAFGQIMGDYATQAGEKMKAVADETGMIETRLTGYMTSLTAKFKGLGFDVSDATTLASDGLRLAADGAAFWDMSLDESVSHLNSFINGSYEGGEAIGLFANDTQMAMYAIEQGIVSETKEWSKLDEATKQATRLEYAQNMYKLSGATGQAAKESNSFLNVQGNLTEAWRQFQATAGEPILNNIVIPAMKKLTEIIPMISAKIPVVIEWVTNMYNKFKQWVDYARGQFQPVVDSLKGLFQNLKTAIGEIVTAIGNFASGLTGGKNASDLMKTAIDLLRGVLTNLVNGLNGIINTIKNFVTWLNSGSAGAEALKAVIVGVTAAFVTFKASIAIQSLIGNLVGKIKNMVTVFKTLWATMAANPVTLIVAAIAALVAAFVYLWNNCEGFRNFWIGLWDGIKNVFNSFLTFCKNAIESIKNFFVNGFNNIKQKTTEIFGKIKDGIMKPIEAAKKTVSDNLNNMKSAFEKHGGGIKGVAAAAMEGVKGYFTSGYSFINNLTGGKLSEIANKVKEKMNSAKQAVENALDGIKKFFSDKLNSAKETVSGIIEKIKGFFSFKISWPKIPMPRFSINPDGWKIGDLLKGSIPKLGIDWYAKGGILDKPTIFGVNGNSLMGGGEAGKEAVAPINTLQEYVRSAVRSELGIMESYMLRLVQTVDKYLPEAAQGRNVVLDTGALVGAMGSNIDVAMGNINRRKERWG